MSPLTKRSLTPKARATSRVDSRSLGTWAPEAMYALLRLSLRARWCHAFVAEVVTARGGCSPRRQSGS